jgi:hypothetical protein
MYRHLGRRGAARDMAGCSESGRGFWKTSTASSRVRAFKPSCACDAPHAEASVFESMRAAGALSHGTGAATRREKDWLLRLASWTESGRDEGSVTAAARLQRSPSSWWTLDSAGSGNGSRRRLGGKLAAGMGSSGSWTWVREWGRRYCARPFLFGISEAFSATGIASD